MNRVRLVADVTIDDSGTAAEGMACLLHALQTIHPEANPEILSLTERPLHAPPSAPPAWCPECGGFRADAKLHLCRCDEDHGPQMPVPRVHEVGPVGRSVVVRNAEEYRARFAEPSPPAKDCPDCQRVIDALADGHPNPEGLMEWWEAGNHVCMPRRQ